MAETDDDGSAFSSDERYAARVAFAVVLLFLRALLALPWMAYEWVSMASKRNAMGDAWVGQEGS